MTDFVAARGLMASHPIEPGTEVTRVDFWSPAAGVDVASPIPAVSPQFASSMVNCRIDDTGYITNGPLYQSYESLAGGAIAAGVFAHYRENGAPIVYIGTRTGIFYKEGTAAAIACTGTAFTDITRDDWFSFVGWGGYVLATNRVVGLQKIDTSTQEYTETSSAPEGCRHVGVLRNRVILTRPTSFPGRVYWSVKGDSDDWTGIGSGYEDLLQAGGSAADRPWGMWPVSDTQGIVVCERSVMVMTATDNVDAPFQFSVIAAIGTPHPNSIAAIPGGVAFVGWDGVYIATTSGIREVARPHVHSQIFTEDTALQPRRMLCFGVYHPHFNEYWINYTIAAGTHKYYAYSLGRNSWNGCNNSATGPGAYVHYSTSGTYDALGGTFGGLTGVVDELPSSNTRKYTVVYCDASVSGSATLNQLSWTGQAQNTEVITGDIELAQPDHRLTVQYASLTYSTSSLTSTHTVTISYSLNGAAWAAYGTFDCLPHSGTDPFQSVHVQTFHRTLDGHHVRFKVASSDAATDFRIIQFSVYCSKGALSFAA